MHRQAVSPKKRVYYKIGGISIVFIVALMVRLSPQIHSPETCRNGLGPFGDTYLYHCIAYNIYQGNGFSGTDDGSAFGRGEPKENREYEPAITRGPVYPFFIASVYRLLGNPRDMESIETWHKNWNKVRIAQCILDALTCLLVFFIVINVHTPAFVPALIAALVYCFSFYNIFYTKALLSESVTTFLLTGAVLFCVVGLKHKRLIWWFLPGVAFGLVILSRPEYMLFPFCFIAYLLSIDRHNITVALKKGVLFIMSAVLVIAPWTIRNYRVFKKPIPISHSGLGYALFLGTFQSKENWRGWGVFPDEIFADEAEKEKILSLYKFHTKHMARGSIKIEAVDKAFLKLALGRIRNNPLQCVMTWIKSIPRLWYQNYIPLYLYREASGMFFIFYFIFGLYGFCVVRREEKILLGPICLLFIYLNLVFLPSAVEPRYGVALMPGIISVAGIGIFKALSLARILHKEW